MCSLVLYVIGKVNLSVLLPACNLIYAAAGIFVKRNVVAVNKLGILCLDEKVVVLSVVLT